MKKQVTLKANRALSVWIGLLGLLVFVMFGVSPLFERNITAQSERKNVEIFDENLAPESGIEPLPNGATGYRYRILATTATIPPGFEQPNFDDTTFTVGQGAFSNQAGCAPPLAVNTAWNSNTRLIARKKISLAANTTNVRLFLTADNDIENVWFNGTLIASNIANNNCPVANELVYNIPQNLLTVGSNNTIAVQVLDRGGNTFFDARVLATVPDPPNPPSCAAVTNGLVAWYKGENNTNDIMNQHNGYPTNIVYEPGRVGQAFSLDGVSDVQIPTNRNLVANQFTVDAWVNPTLYDANFGSRVISRLGSYEMLLLNDGQFRFYITGVSGLPNEGSGYTYGGANVPLNQWTHIALTYDGSIVRTYTNGILRREITGVTGNVSDGLNPFVIGSTVGLTGTDKFDGLIDEVGFYNRALADTEIGAIFAANNAGRCTPPVLPAPSCTPPPLDLVSWYRGENNATDTKSGNFGYATNNVTYAQGRVGQAFSFDGTGDVSIPSNVSFAQPTFTVGAWVNPTLYDANFGSRVISRLNSYEMLLLNDGQFRFYITGVSGLPNEGSGYTYGGATIPRNQWTHIALTYDGSRVRTFINGRIARQITGVTGNVSDGLNPFVIGSSFGLTGTDKFDGLIDEVIYFNRGLSEAEMRQIVDANTAGMCAPPPTAPSCVAPPTNLVSWWKGQTNAFDGIGSNNGTLGSGVSFANGKVGQAFSFNGTNGVTVPSSPSLLAPTFTVGAWVNPTLYNANFGSRVISRLNSYEMLLLNDGQFRFYITGVSGLPNEGSGYTYGGATVPLNQWTHIALSFDGTRVRTFINGRIARQFIGVSGAVANSTSPFVIGSTSGLNGGDNFDGLIDEVQYFSRALGENELKGIVDADNQGICNSNSARKAVGDFDGDNKSDIAVFRPNVGTWFGIRSSDSQIIQQNFGMNGDKIIPADYDGDNKTDFAVFRPDIGAWYVLNSATNTVRASLYGLPTDIPMPGDFDGDNKADLAVFRPTTGTWYVLQSSNGEFRGTQFGTNGDVPVIGDFDGDNKTDLTVYRNGIWFVLRSSGGDTAIQWGIAGDKTVPGDYNGDGKTDYAVFRDGFWYVLLNGGGFIGAQWGAIGDLASPADYDGDGRTDLAVFRNGNWFIQRTTAGVQIVNFGSAGDKPVPNAFVP